MQQPGTALAGTAADVRGVLPVLFRLHHAGAADRQAAVDELEEHMQPFLEASPKDLTAQVGWAAA